MSNIKTQLEVGDKIVRNEYGHLNVLAITRVTPKRAYAKYSSFGAEFEFYRECRNNTAGGIGTTKNWTLYNEIDHAPIIKRQALENAAREKLNRVDTSKLTNETLEKLIELLNQTK